MLQPLLKIVVFSLVALFLGLPLSANKLEKGFEALKIYDYFLAKKLFYAEQKKKADAYSAYGLALIYSRTDNPFSNADSACKYITRSYHRYLAKPMAVNYSGFLIDSATIRDQAKLISRNVYEDIRKMSAVKAYDFFLEHYYLADKTLLEEAVYRRDELEFNQVREINHSDSTARFLLLHPLSKLYDEGQRLREQQIYNENTASGTAEEYIAFLNQFPEHSMKKIAQEKLFNMYRQQKDTAGLSFFVSRFPEAPQTLEAWKLLFSLSVKDFSFSELERFVGLYPQFPLKNSILEELELNKLVLYAYQQEDFYGFIDEQGKLVIEPLYDAVSDFYEGLSLVVKNDSVFFINKQNTNPFNLIFQDALVFRNGIAAVKQAGKWYFINRQGQIISKAYDEINERSDDVYVVKLENKFGAVDHFGEVLLENQFNKLGDFQNGFAYYTEQGAYGFVSKTGQTSKAEYEWISEFNQEGIAIIKQKGKYGLVSGQGKIILEALYDQVLPADSSLFIVVKDNVYGFYSGSACFLTPVVYDYVKEQPADFYTNGHFIKLLKGNEQALVDVNGAVIIGFGAYQEVHFPKSGRMRVKQKNKYGFLDEKLNPFIILKYQEAQDFSDSTAVVKWKEESILLNTAGKEVFSTHAEIVKISSQYFLINENPRKLVNAKGELVFSEVEGVQKQNRLLLVTLNNGEIKLINE